MVKMMRCDVVVSIMKFNDEEDGEIMGFHGENSEIQWR